MAYEGSDEWAIIESGLDDKITTERLTDWFSYEWGDFKTLKKDGDIVWFDSKAEAVEFIMNNFDKEVISPELLKDDVPEGYEW